VACEFPYRCGRVTLRTATSIYFTFYIIILKVLKPIVFVISHFHTRVPIVVHNCRRHTQRKKGKSSPYWIDERRLPDLIPDVGSQPAGDVSHKPGVRLPLLSARPAVTLVTLKKAATSFAAW